MPEGEGCHRFLHALAACVLSWHQPTHPSCASPLPSQYARDLPEYPCAANGTGAVDFNASSPNRGNDTNPAVTYTNPAYMTTIVCAAPVRRQPAAFGAVLTVDPIRCPLHPLARRVTKR